MKNLRYHNSVPLVLLFKLYIHVSNNKRTNLEPSSIKGIFVGYSETSILETEPSSVEEADAKQVLQDATTE